MLWYEISKISGVGSREKQEASSTDGLWLMGKDTYPHQLLKLFERTVTHLTLVFFKRIKFVIGADLWKYWIKGFKKKKRKKKNADLDSIGNWKSAFQQTETQSQRHESY